MNTSNVIFCYNRKGLCWELGVGFNIEEHPTRLINIENYLATTNIHSSISSLMIIILVFILLYNNNNHQFMFFSIK